MTACHLGSLVDRERRLVWLATMESAAPPPKGGLHHGGRRQRCSFPSTPALQLSKNYFASWVATSSGGRTDASRFQPRIVIGIGRRHRRCHVMDRYHTQLSASTCRYLRARFLRCFCCLAGAPSDSRTQAWSAAGFGRGDRPRHAMLQQRRCKAQSFNVCKRPTMKRRRTEASRPQCDDGLSALQCVTLLRIRSSDTIG